MFLAVNPNVIFHAVGDVIVVNSLYFSHGIPMDIINESLYLITSKYPRDFVIYVIYSTDEMFNIIEAEEQNPNTDITSFTSGEIVKLNGYDIVECIANEDNLVLPREKFNLGISFLFIIKTLQQPMQRIPQH